MFINQIFLKNSEEKKPDYIEDDPQLLEFWNSTLEINKLNACFHNKQISVSAKNFKINSQNELVRMLTLKDINKIADQFNSSDFYEKYLSMLIF
ncbi:hypothetical protein [Rickettsiella massiliensis]|uniref:hypothetical protein n=1 Tax=Rickettsiella massiliensis TaxID=676517 RepID=UPI00029B07CF|nr:hypothetical protein [Rickettsiella massiliensis]